MGIVLDQIKSFRATDNLATVYWRSISEPLCGGVSLQFAIAFCIQMCFDTSNNNFHIRTVRLDIIKVLFIHQLMP